eukprot:jgi/Mesvir1/26740/Mv20516-RA.1
MGWVRGSVGSCASGIGKTLTREQLERLVATLYKDLPAAFVKKTPTPTLCILVGDEVVGRMLMNMCKQALQGSPDAHERLVHVAFMLTKTSKDVLFRIPKEYLCEIISRATNTTQRVAMLQHTPEFNKRFGNEDYRELGMRAGRAFANEVGGDEWAPDGMGRGGGGRGMPPMFVNNVYPRGPVRRQGPPVGGGANVYFGAQPPRMQNPWTHYGGQARTAHEAACCQVVQHSLNSAHQMRAERIAGALNPYTKAGRSEDPSPGVPADNQTHATSDKLKGQASKAYERHFNSFLDEIKNATTSREVTDKKLEALGLLAFVQIGDKQGTGVKAEESRALVQSLADWRTKQLRAKGTAGASSSARQTRVRRKAPAKHKSRAKAVKKKAPAKAKKDAPKKRTAKSASAAGHCIGVNSKSIFCG